MAKTITFNEKKQFDYIYSTTGGGVTFGSNLAASTAFNYFSNSAVVNDAIYFGRNFCMSFSDISFNVGTALSATSITVGWERWSGSAWVAITGLTDNTNAFRNTGENTVTFPVFQATNKAVNSSSYVMWVRCRITAVSGITNGGAQSTNTVKYNDWSITASYPGSTITTFCTDLYNASVAGGWGVVAKTSSQTYYFNCHILIGYSADSAITTLDDSSVNMVIDGMVQAQKAYSIISIGTITNSSKHITTNGCSVINTKFLHQFWSDGTGYELWKIYSSLFKFTAYRLATAWNSIVYSSFHYSNCDVYNTQYLVGCDFTGATSTYGVADRVQLIGVSDGFRQEFFDYIKNATISGASFSGYVGSNTTNLDFDNVTINLISDGTGINWKATPTDSRLIGVKVGREYTLNLTVVDTASSPINGAKVLFVDVDGYDSAFKEAGGCGSMNYTTTQFVPSVNEWSVGDTIRRGNENMLITSGTYPNFVVTRGTRGTQARTTTSVTKTLQKLYPIVSTDASGLTGTLMIEGSNEYWVSGTSPGVTGYQYRNPFTLTIKKYGYLTYATSLTVTRETALSIVMKNDPVLVKSETNAGLITGITINHSTQTITITGDVSINDIYDYAHWDILQGSNPNFPVPISSSDGINFTSTYNLVVDTGVALSGTFGLTLSGGATLTMTGTATSSGNITHTSGTKVWTRILLSGLTTNSRVQLYDTTSSTELYNAVVAATSLEYQTDWTTDHTIRYRISYVNGATAKNFIEASGTFSSGGLSVAIAQTDDAVYIANAISGSTVTGITITPSPARVKINLAGGTVSWASIYAYQVYWLYGATGIADEAAFIIASDTANYTLYGFDIRNDSTTALTLTGGWGKDSVTDTIAGVIDVAGSTGNIYAEPDHIIPYNANTKTLLTVSKFLALK